ncbi:hypothetical protein AL755_13730 [Arthrobacter sp. ERGS1:01]|uniref:hypothetical protein n=1 Tax=Arthrobacter sp. ERGS1:01 TaxID=1704044 RepID=UPI0006B5C0D4|nr:hypothetical protein [Arthrobacter sp. ERGS1:01]ALE06274.1 hypothetical protein AL755_13730 [Arthrobacter sp. ERGS1:01]
MSDKTYAVAGDTADVQGSGLVSVQPREIIETAFRALCAAGGDPAEAQEGGLAVLRAEADAQVGLALLEQLLEADWTQPMVPADTQSTSWAGVAVYELNCPGQPALRSAIQLMDLACSGSAEEVRVARTTVAGIPRPLWNDLLLRYSARLQRTIIIAITTAAATGTGGTEYLSVRNGAITTTTEPPSEAIAASLLPTADGNETVVVVLPYHAEAIQQDAGITQRPLKVRDEQWHRMYQLSRNYLMADQ